MSNVGARERITQNRVIKLFQNELGYTYLGDWQDRDDNANIEEVQVRHYLKKRGYSPAQINKALFQLTSTAKNFHDSLYATNKEVYQLLRYGADIKTEIGKNTEKVHFIDWKDVSKNEFAIAEEVTIRGDHTKRPDIVIYVNGIALGVIELKRSTVPLSEAIRQNIVNQRNEFIQPFFATIQFVFAGNDTEGLRYGTIGTEEKYFLKWKEDIEDNSRLLLDKYLLKMCQKERFLEIIYDFVVFDGRKKLPRVHQYFGIKAAQKYVNRYEGGIIWHTQGSGKSLTMVLLAKWILENNPHARVAIVTDRVELDKQIKGVFKDTGEPIERATSGKDLMLLLSQPAPRLLCSLIHKFGKRDTSNFSQFIKELESQPVQTVGELFVFVDECHRTQSGRLHRTMKAILPNAVFIGFTGTPLLKEDKQTSQEVFGTYIHTYKFNEGVADGVILDLVYEARDIDQRISSYKNIDEWFELATEKLTDFQKSELKKKWGTMQKVLSSRSRMEKVVNDILLDFKKRPRLKSQLGNAMLVAGSIYEACRYYELFLNTSLKDKCAIITSYSPNTSDITTEDTGTSTETEKEFMYNLYKNVLGSQSTEQYEDWAKAKFSDEPANMKLLIVVSKLLTGFDAPTCTYLYIDKSMQDHGLFQAICRVNRLHSEDKQFGYIVDYKDLFRKVENAVAVYTSELDYENFDKADIDILLKNRLEDGKKRLDNALEEIRLLCEPVKPPKDTLAHIRYFCGNTEVKAELEEREIQRTALYKKTVALLRAYANIEEELEEAGYSSAEIDEIKREREHYIKLREEIRKASGETLDLKSYEADMRHLIDTYIQAEDPERISDFEGMTLLDIITALSMARAIESLPEGIRSSPEAIAETIENNVRRKIINEHLTDPAYFDKMSQLLEEVIRQRKANAISYEAYLKEVEEIAKKVNAGKTDETPDILKTPGQIALYNNLGHNVDLAVNIHEAVEKNKKDGWKGVKPKEQEIKKAIYMELVKHQQETEGVNDPMANYELMEKVEGIFDIIKAQKEY